MKAAFDNHIEVAYCRYCNRTLNGATAIIDKITDSTGHVIPNNPEYDLEQICKDHFTDVQAETYLRTGRII